MKYIQFILILVPTLFTSCNSKAQQPMAQIDFAQTFIADFESYRMDIEAAGLATLPVATLSEEGRLYIEYAYDAEEEKRKGKMTLMYSKALKKNPKSNGAKGSPNPNGFQGSWKTVADNGTVYQGDLYFVFEKDGQATGFYQFSGSDYKITIFKL